jgi:hypothetical protein
MSLSIGFRRAPKIKERKPLQKAVPRRNASIMQHQEGANLGKLASTFTVREKKGKRRLKRLI